MVFFWSEILKGSKKNYRTQFRCYSHLQRESR